jgi:hypothetical protein
LTNYINKAKESVNNFFLKNKKAVGNINILINTTNYIKTAFKLCVLLIGAKLLLSIFSGKKWISLIVIPFLLITSYFVFYFIKDTVNIGMPEGISINGVGTRNMLIGAILFYISILLNLLF